MPFIDLRARSSACRLLTIYRGPAQNAFPTRRRDWPRNLRGIRSARRRSETDDLKDYTMSDMQTGTVKFFNTTKGFGFIAPEGGGDDVFVHISALQRSGLDSINEGDKVQFNTAVNQRSGKTAVDSISMG
jgi:CspA family cold shock protein